MKHQVFALSFGLIAVLFATQVVHAQQTNTNCAQRQIVLERLQSGFGETRRSMGLAANNGIVEVHASEDGSWSITVTHPNGLTCLVAAGQSFEALNEELPVEPGIPT